MRLPRALARCLRAVSRAAARSNIAVYVVGGCVRDDLLKRSVRDVDILVEGDAARLAQSVPGAAVEVFDRFGTVRLRFPGGLRADLARARSESYLRPAALPVVRPAKLAQDLKRRDFTINAMARPLTAEGAGKLIDLCGGAKDLRARLLRVLHPASFADDPTRMFRAARYAGRLGLRLEGGTAALLKGAVRRNLASELSRERIRQEIVRILDEQRPDGAMRRLRAWGLWGALHPCFRWPKTASAAAGAETRLGLCAMAMPGESGLKFLRSLPLAHHCAQELALALKLRDQRASPRARPPKLTRELLERHFKKLPPKALEPLFIGGRDLKKLGLAPGKEYAALLAKAARAQWRGEFLTRAGARRWLAERATR